MPTHHRQEMSRTSSVTPLRIGTRASPLALWQAEHVRAGLLRAHPEIPVEIVPMTTQGDRMLAVPLHEIGGKGLFVKEIEAALLEGTVDLAVHSMKDVPAQQPEGLEIAAILAREDVRDAWVSNTFARPEDLPQGGRVGSSSLRRRAQLLHRLPQTVVLDLRGNVATRLRKLDAGDYDGIVLAAAGLKRLGLLERIRHYLEPELSLPAVGQGAIGVEIRSDDARTRTLLEPLNDPTTSRCVGAERHMNRLLGGDCRLPVAALAEADGTGLRLRGLVASPDGRELLRAEAVGSLAHSVGEQVAQALLAQGAQHIIDEVKRA